MSRAFTLIELLVVIVIVLIVSVLVIPSAYYALSHRQVSEGARVLQGALVGARDEAIHTNGPSGIRLLPDPAFPLRWLANGTIDPSLPIAANRIIPIAPAPNYTEGNVSRYPGWDYSALTPLPCLVAEESAGSWKQPGGPGSPYVFIINSPSSWFWNIRVGDKIQFGGAGKWYTVVGPMLIGPAQGNSEMFANIGAPATPSPWSRLLAAPDGQSIMTQPEFLFLVNGRDDNANGWIDEGFDGVDNNGNGLIDEAAEWEVETW